MQISEEARAHVRTLEFATWVAAFLDRQIKNTPEPFEPMDIVRFLGVFVVAGLLGRKEEADLRELFEDPSPVELILKENHAEWEAAMTLLEENLLKIKLVGHTWH
jgi:hypothetical protein